MLQVFPSSAPTLDLSTLATILNPMGTSLPSTFSVGGKKVCRIGDQASCLDTVSVGSSTFFVGS